MRAAAPALTRERLRASEMARARWAGPGRALLAATALLAALPRARPGPPAPCPPLCSCRGEHLACDGVPFHRFPRVGGGVRHVSAAGARLGALEAAALDGLPLRTLVLTAAALHAVERGALASMVATLASLDLSHNEFTEVPIEELRELKVLNWLNLQSNCIAELEPEMEWGFLADTLSSLSLGRNQLRSLSDGALVRLRRLTQLDLEGNRLLALAARALPPAVALLRLSDNLLAALPCGALEHLPRLRHLHLRANALRAALHDDCAEPRFAVESLDLAQNELDDAFALDLQPRSRLRRLILDLNDFTAIPPWVLEGGARLERLSLSHNHLVRVSAAAAHALRSLVRLDLDHNALEAPPVALRALVQLRRLDLSYNRLSALLDPPPHLHYLSLAGNRFAAVPAGLRELAPASLVLLDLGYNQISSLSADAFGSWSEALGTLNLRGNRIGHLAADAFPSTLPLHELMLSFNDLYRVESGAFSNLTALQMLELSSTLFGGEFPAAASDNVTWLSLDNSNIHRVSPDDLLGFPSLEYLNLDFNKIIEFPGEVIGANGFRLKELRLSYNNINEISSDFLRESPELRSVDLSYNRIRNVSARAFSELPALQYLNLAGNLLMHLTPRALSALPRLEALDLHDNQLTELSVASFELVAGDAAEFTVNASRNRIARLAGGVAFRVPVVVLDLERNLLESLEPAFFAAVSAHLRRLALAYNRLASLDSLGALPHLRVLSLSDNGIAVVKRRALADAPALQVLDLSGNALRQLAAEQFRGQRHLRHLRLAGNLLRALPRDCLRDTVLEHLDLADNQLAAFPQSALAAVGFTLRLLSLARNRLEHLDAAALRTCAELRELSLAGNQFTELADGTLAPLVRLRALNLSSNLISADFEKLLRATPRLRSLALAHAGLRAAPALPLPQLVDLDLSSNRLAALREADPRRHERLRTLNIAGNAFTSLRPTMWAAMPLLASLDASANPIARLGRGSFEGLPRLLSLRLERLRRLTALEPRALDPLPALRELALEWPLDAGGHGASVADLLGRAPSLEALTLVVRSRSLETQLRGVRAGRLRAVEVRGARLRFVSADAFTSLGAARALTLRLRGSGVTRLPAALTRPLEHVPHLALDLSDNQLVELAPATLYPNLTGWKRFSTELLPGGLVVSGNPLPCGCGVSWAGAWLRRWTAEVGGWTEGARRAARASSCEGVGGRRVSLLSLGAGRGVECGASALSSRAPPRAALTSFLWMVLLCSVS